MVASTHSPLNDIQQIDMDDWSDPHIALQVEAFVKRVIASDEQVLSTAEEIDAEAEYLCEWSRNLLNRMFGRTTHSELVHVQTIFEATSRIIDTWAERVPASDLLGKINAYSQHIRERTAVRLVG